MGFSARSRSLQRVLVLFALVGAGVALSTNTLSTFQSPKAILVVTVGALVAVLGAARAGVTSEVRLRRRELLGAAGAFVLLAVAATFLSDAPAMSIAGEYDRQSGLVVYAAYFAVLCLRTRRVLDLDRGIPGADDEQAGHAARSRRTRIWRVNVGYARG